MRRSYAIITCIMVLPAVAFTQQPCTDCMISLPDKLFGQINKTVVSMQHQLEQQTARYIDKIVRCEQQLRRRLMKTDSAAARRLFGEASLHWLQMDAMVNNRPGNTPYIPYLDTLRTSLQFLQQYPALLTNAQATASQATTGIAHIQALEGQLQRADAINQMLREREQYLRDQLQNFGFTKALNRLNKQVYYYSQQVNEYKELLKHPGKIERKAINLLSRSTVFQEFMRRHSQLAGLFRLPGNDDNLFIGAGYTSLQTREQVTGILQQQLSASGPNAQQQFQQQLQTAQAELGKLQDKLLRSSSRVGGHAGDMPSFTPNNQKTKSFKHRLELGTNLQSQKASHYFPVTTDIGFSLGYKLNDQSTAGIGASYKIGLGQGWNDIKITHQGAGIRSFIDWKIKNSFWCSGGFEMNYRAVLSDRNTTVPSTQTIPGSIVWQQSGLIGLSKKYQAGKKFTGKAQLLWDFLSYRQIPRSQPIVFRVGYDLPTFFSKP
ncbi:MAG: hypothetical protein J7621_29640 [Niastella sp.]|nr:hypothetical protein [Niastella sp.]